MKPRRPLSARSVRLRRGLTYAFGAGAAAALSLGGCATEVNSFDPDDEPNTAGTSSPGKGGSKATGGGPSAKAGTGTQAFGGTTTVGGKGGTSSAAAGSDSAGGTAGNSSGGSGGAQAGSSNGGGGSSAAGSGGTGVATGCLKDWKDNETCDTCTTQTQDDKLGCVDILDCYAVNDCGPSTCATNDDKCGANTIKKGTAGYEIAAEVHACICK